MLRFVACQPGKCFKSKHCQTVSRVLTTPPAVTCFKTKRWLAENASICGVSTRKVLQIETLPGCQPGYYDASTAACFKTKRWSLEDASICGVSTPEVLQIEALPDGQPGSHTARRGRTRATVTNRESGGQEDTRMKAPALFWQGPLSYSETPETPDTMPLIMSVRSHITPSTVPCRP